MNIIFKIAYNIITKLFILLTNQFHTHTPAAAVEENRINATCVSDGSYDEVVYCSECGEELSRVERLLEMSDHTEAVVPEKASTCTEEGLSEGLACSECGEILLAQIPLPLDSHTYDSETDADCNVCGHIRSVPLSIQSALQRE